MLHTLVMLLLTLQNNMITPHFRENKLTEANVLLRSAFLSDLLLSARTLNKANKVNMQLHFSHPFNTSIKAVAKCHSFNGDVKWMVKM